MKTKDKIVERLLEDKHITTEEAIVLLKERTPIGFQQFTPNTIIGQDGKVPYHTTCGCDICHCVMANKMVDPNGFGNFYTDNTFTISKHIKPESYPNSGGACFYKVVGHAFSEGNCTVCAKDISCSHTPCDPVCRECSLKEDICMSCGDTLGWKPEVWNFEKHSDEPYVEVKPKEIIEYFPGKEKTPENIFSVTTVHELTANEILDRYKDYLDPTSEEMLLGHISRNLVLDREYKAKGTWQDILRYAENMGKEKQMLEALILQFFHELKKAKINWIREDHWKDTSVEDKVQEIITSYEKHFNITTQRHGTEPNTSRH